MPKKIEAKQEDALCLASMLFRVSGAGYVPMALVRLKRPDFRFSANPAVRITSLFGQQTAGYLPRSKQKRGTAAFISNKLCFDRKTK